MQLGDLEKRCKLPSGSGRSPVAKRHLLHSWSENALSGKAITGYCKCLLTKLCQQIVPSHFRVSLIRQRKISFSITFGNRKKQISQLLICDKVIPLTLEIGPLKPSYGF